MKSVFGRFSTERDWKIESRSGRVGQKSGVRVIALRNGKVVHVKDFVFDLGEHFRGRSRLARWIGPEATRIRQIKGDTAMEVKKVALDGTIAGFAMGIFLFVGGAVLSRIIYGPQFAPPGKFTPEQLNAFYFVWTKLVIGWIFGILFVVSYELLPLSKKLTGAVHGMIYAFSLWLLMTLWSLSHPLVYGTVNVPDQTFWILYQLVGFLGFGAVLGYLYRRRAKKSVPPARGVERQLA